MLQIVKQCITDLPKSKFEDYYQQYVAQVQDEIIDRDIQRANKLYNRIDDMPKLIEGLNVLTEELNHL